MIALFPFNGSRWFWTNIIDYSINALHLVDDLIGNLYKNGAGRGYQSRSSHQQSDSAQCQNRLVRSFISHNPNAARIQQDGSCSNFFIKFLFLQSSNEDRISFLQHSHSFFCDGAKNAYRKTWPRKDVCLLSLRAYSFAFQHAELHLWTTYVEVLQVLGQVFRGALLHYDAT